MGVMPGIMSSEFIFKLGPAKVLNQSGVFWMRIYWKL